MHDRRPPARTGELRGARTGELRAGTGRLRPARTGDLRASALRALLTPDPVVPRAPRGRQHRANGLAPQHRPRRSPRRWSGDWVRPDRWRR